jgi:hypothetical protein
MILRSKHVPIAGSIPVFPEETEENHVILSDNNGCPSWDLNRMPPKYKSEAMPLEPTCSVDKPTWLNV